jgi:pyridoxine 5-phosphate synthase
MAELGGADGITIHLREDRRHIQDRDAELLRRTVATRLNLESSIDAAMVALAIELRPDQVTFVPERRAEVTTEGGLDAVLHREGVAEAMSACAAAGLPVSLFIDPDPAQVDVAAELGAAAVELHTGRYADARSDAEVARELHALRAAAARAVERGLALHAGHGLNYINVAAVARIEGMRELNIGHSLVSRAVFVGLERAVGEMKRVIDAARVRGT